MVHLPVTEFSGYVQGSVPEAVAGVDIGSILKQKLEFKSDKFQSNKTRLVCFSIRYLTVGQLSLFNFARTAKRTSLSLSPNLNATT